MKREDSTINELESQLEGINKEISRYEKDIDSIISSRFWTVTKPLRVVSGMADKFISKLQSSKYRKAEELIEIDKLRYQLRNNGFEQRAYLELDKYAKKGKTPQARRSAAWQLVIWHANRHTKENALKGLYYLGKAKSKESDLEQRRRIAVLEAELLETVGKKNDSKRVIKKALKHPHPDLYLALANLQDTDSDRISLINKALRDWGLLEVTSELGSSPSLYDSLKTKEYNGALSAVAKKINNHKVSIIVPVYNAENTIRPVIGSLLSQTWKNIEIIIVDDCSTDGTWKVLTELETLDSRIKIIRAKKNAGAYTARNIGLSISTGDFITINDSDDWSHAQKIELQALHLIDNPHIVANIATQARLSEDLKFYRRGNPGHYIFTNISSLMYKRSPVFKEIGYWNSVRFGADSEYLNRIKKAFGQDSVVVLDKALTSFQRQAKGSLTADEKFGFPGFFMGARREYDEAQRYFHKNAKSLYYDFPTAQTPFVVPYPMRPEREKGSTRHFDVIIMSDFRLDGGSTLSSIEEIKAQKLRGLKTGLVQAHSFEYWDPFKLINEKVRDQVDGESVEFIVYGETVSCDHLIVRYPPVLNEVQKYLPEIKAKNISVIVNQTPMSDYSEDGEVRYDLKKCTSNLKTYFKKDAKWYPIGPNAREALFEYHKKELRYIDLQEEDWVNIINIDEWKRGDYSPNPDRPVIGRHSRPDKLKWPNNKDDILSLYPDDEKYKVRILGGADAPESILGYRPRSWEVIYFGELEPKEFLKNLDVFVYFTHPAWVESFGRVIFEAMAVGVPVLLPITYKKVFHDAAIYVQPQEAKTAINKIVADKKLYKTQVKKAQDYIRKNYSYDKHITRLKIDTK